MRTYFSIPRGCMPVHSKPFHALLRTTLLLMAVVIPMVCRAQGFPPITPDELKMTSEPQAPGAAAVILFREVDRDDNGSTTHEDNYVRIKILTEEGRKYADVDIPFSKADGDVVHVRARTIKPDGSGAESNVKVFEKTIEKAKGVKYLAKTFTLPNVEVGSIIEFSYTYDYREQYIYDSSWVLSSDLFTRYARFSLKPYVSKYQSWNLRWTWRGLPPGAEPKEGPDHILRMEARNIPPYQIEDFMPPLTELRARVNFIYENEYLETTADQYWRHVGKKLNGQLEGFVDKRKAMEEAENQIVSPGDAPEVKLRKIYDRVQTIRNTSYELQKTEEELKREKEKPIQNVEDLWKRGYGDGIQLTWLFVALARAAGFDARGVWVSSRSAYFFAPNTMERGKLNTNVAQVKLNGKDLYFDPGAAFTPYGLLTWPETGVQGLCLNKDGGTWVQTALPEAVESKVQRTAKFKLTDSGNLEGRVTVTYTGLQSMYHRLDVMHSDDVARKKYMEDALKEQIPVAAEVELTNKPDWISSENPLVGEFDVTISGWGSSAGKRALVPIGIFSAGERNTFEHANRVNPIYVDFPSAKSDDVTIELPAGWKVDSVPTSKTSEGHVVTYNLQVENDHGTLHVKRNFTMDFLLLEPKYYGALRTFFQTVRTGDDQQAVLLPAATAAVN